MTLMSPTTIGMFLFSLPFWVIALHSLGKYLKDRQNPQKKHVFYAFLCVSIGFISGMIGTVIASADMDAGKIMILNILFGLFDAFNIIGAFWFFVFLTDFMEKVKKYIIFVVMHLGVALALIFLTPAGVIMLGEEPLIERAGIRSLAVLSFWFIYWGELAYQFLKLSKSMTNTVAMRRSQMMSAGAVFAILAYVFTVIAGISQDIVFKFLSHASAALSGIVFYAGFIAPDWLKKIWEKRT